MTLSESDLDPNDIDPIDRAEYVAEHNGWEFDRVSDDQIAVSIPSQWNAQGYSITLAWSSYDQTLRLICTYELGPTEDRMPALFELLNAMNDRCWSGAFTWWEEQQLMVYRYGLILSGDMIASPEQIDTMIGSAVYTCDKYYPVIQLVLWEEKTADEAMQSAFDRTFGRA